MRSTRLLLTVILIMALPAGAGAHGTDYRVLDEARVVAAEFFYSDKEPMRYAEVLVFSPENREVEYQNGRTDQNGRFAFCPETAGKWQIHVNDGMGHAVRAEIPVDSPETGSKEVKGLSDKKPLAATSRWIKILLGLSLMLNLFLGIYVKKKGAA
ncbi:MAG: hypothetical protein KGY56_00225 [Desulfobacterales bacterium]|nr:hypothetical protein [Desulfobacterales bacterium]